MADIKFKGFVEPHTGRGPWTIVENHRKRNDVTEEWTTESKTYHRVWLPDGVEPPEGALVEVTGRQKTNVYLKDGEKKYSLIVNAETVDIVSGGSSSMKTEEPWAGYSPVDSDAPF